ncbi:class I adenylate-forming enzyme family protein [Streptomyces sp. SAS_281]|uniref:class I adenylate-forming enzyme family protein n=1 Tax=Streptomyces sp. SAS_281 TaxID=3412744 RepID=UPI00403C1E01
MTSQARQDLVTRILAHGVHVNDEPLDVAGSSFHLLCDQLDQAGVQPGNIVVLRGLQGRDLVSAAMAVWKLNAVPLPVPLQGHSRDDEAAQALFDACQITETLTVLPAAPSHKAIRLGTTAVLHRSSGSTGSPKLARRSVASVLQDAEGYRSGLGLTPGERVAIPVPLMHSFGWGITIGALLSGCDVDVAPFVRASALAHKVDSGTASVLAITPPVARLLVETQRQGKSVPRAAMAGAGPVPNDLDEAFRTRFGVPLLRGYGSTETGGTFFGDRGMGRPVHGVDIVAPSPGERGELILRLAAPVEGYLGDEHIPLRKWHTRDIVRHDVDGCVYFEARAQGPLRLNGRFIDANITEQILRAVPGVTNVSLLVLPRSESPETEDFYAVVEGNAAEENLLASLAESPAGVPIPRVIVCEQLPTTTLGKRDRGALIEMVRKASG